MEKTFYESDVSFMDPLLDITGIDKYQSNVDMLAGRNMFGSLLFKDASIALHSIVKPSENKLMTRWTLRVTVKAIPWAPTARFTGVSIYTLNSSGKVIKQEDYWDSINLKNGQYEKVPFLEGLSDFLGQLKQEAGAQVAAPEMPYELLRRANRYEIRRYPAYLAAETIYDQRNEGYDRLGSYAQGSNSGDVRLEYFSPTLMRINDANGRRSKVMSWPLAYKMPGSSLPSLSTLPEPTISRIKLIEQPESVIAVTRFEMPATEP
eukprot:gene40801-54002_t